MKSETVLSGRRNAPDKYCPDWKPVEIPFDYILTAAKHQQHTHVTPRRILRFNITTVETSQPTYLVWAMANVPPHAWLVTVNMLLMLGAGSHTCHIRHVACTITDYRINISVNFIISTIWLKSMIMYVIEKAYVQIWIRNVEQTLCSLDMI